MNQPSSIRKVAVIGAGPAGITAAYELAKAGVEVDLYEASNEVGGLAKTIELWGQKVDIGPHRFFSNDTRINKAWLEVVGKDYHMVDRLTRIYYKKKFYYYPLKAGDALKKLGFFTSAACMMSFMWQKVRPVKQDGTFESWVVSRFGRKLYSIFFKTYTEKLWGIPCTELDADFAAQRIKKLSLWEAVKNAVTGGKNNKHKTLVDQFAYPVGGTGMVYERMKEFVLSKGGRVHLRTPVQRILTEGGTATALELEDGSIQTFDHIVSSMPFTLMVSRLPEAPSHITELCKGLTFRNTVLVYLHVQGKDLFPDNWLYVHSSDLKMGRITNFRNWVPEILNGKDTTIVALEYWCYDHDEEWSRDEKYWVDLATDELRKTGLIGDAPITEGMMYRIPRCYPVYGKGYKDKLKPIEEYLSSVKNLSVIGRYGAFKYNNQDHSILMGLLAAENITKGTSHNLWEINTDYEDYQESSTITASGLGSEILITSTMSSFTQFSITDIAFFISAFVAAGLSLHFFLKGNTRIALLFLLMSALALRLFAILADPFFHLWDEQFHALVAKHMAEHPLRPTLVEDPILPYDITDWSSNHIWVHKQPLFLWQMAASIKLFGVHYWSVRVPSLILSLLLVVLVYDTGKRIMDTKTGYLAALLLSFSYSQIEMLSGRLHTDHNDISFMFYVFASLWAYVRYRHHPSIKWAILIGALAGCAVLTKWLVGLLVFLPWVIEWIYSLLKKSAIKPWYHFVMAGVVCVFIFLPWQLYTALRFPAESAYERAFTQLHLQMAVEGHGGSWYFHFEQWYNLMGGLVLLFAMVGLVIMLRSRTLRTISAPLLIALLAVVVFYTWVPTKMMLFTAPAFPILLITAGTGFQIMMGQVKRHFLHGALVLACMFLVLDTNTLDRYHTIRDEYRTLRLRNEERIRTIVDNTTEQDAVFVNTGSHNHILFMLYSDHTAYRSLPDEAEWSVLMEKHVPVKVFPNGDLPEYIKESEKVKIMAEPLTAF